MTPFDMVVVGVVVFTSVIALWRGLVREAIALAGWFVAAWAALSLSGPLDRELAGFVENSLVRAGLAFVAPFVVVLVATAFAGIVLSKLVRLAGLGIADRVLGAVFGLLKGSILVLLLVLVAGLTTLPRHPWWQESSLGAPLAAAALALRPWLPAGIASRLEYPQAPDARHSLAREHLQAGRFGV